MYICCELNNSVIIFTTFFVMSKISEKTIERLILYRRIILGLKPFEKANVFSHELSSLTGFSSAQIRRDLMAIGYSGSPIKGYNLEQLIQSISNFIDAPQKQNVALIGLGKVGRAILNYFQGRRPRLQIKSAFDLDPVKIGKTINNCVCYHIDDLENIIKKHKIVAAILAIPVDEAHVIAERLINTGIKGILNYTPTKLHVPENIFVENRDMIMAVEKVAYFARQLD